LRPLLRHLKLAESRRKWETREGTISLTARDKADNRDVS
jgi:hypothetical protein